MKHLPLFVNLFIQTILIWETTTQEVIVEDYTYLDLLKFRGSQMWIIDSININDNHIFNSIFLFKSFAFCLQLEIGCSLFEKPSSHPILFITVYFKNTTKWSKSYYGPVNGTFLNDNSNDYRFPGCPPEKRLNFVYTDYLNVIVLLGGDERSGPQIMILKSKNTNMTNVQRMDLIKSKIKHSFVFENLKKIEPIACPSWQEIYEKHKTIYLPKCKKFIELKEEEKKYFIYKCFLIVLVVTGLLWIIVYGIYWMKARKNVIVPRRAEIQLT